MIDHLAAGQRPALSRTKRLALAVLAGALVVLGVLWVINGFGTNQAQTMLTGALWMKCTFTLAVATAAFGLCARVVRPESGPNWWLAEVMVPPLLAAGTASIELLGVSPAELAILVRRHSALECLWLIAALSAPLVLTAQRAFRRLAPTRFRLAGFSGVLLAGAVAAAVYSLHCDETSTAFVSTRYGLGMLLGPRMLRR